MQSISKKSSPLAELYGDATKFLVKFSPARQADYCRNAESCLGRSTPTIGAVSRAYGQNVAETWIEIQLNDLSEFAGCKAKMSLAQIAETARVIEAGYGYLNITELMLFFFKFKMGGYGKFYGSVDGLAITNALNEFCAWRRERLEVRRRAEEKAKREKLYALWKQQAVSYEQWQAMKRNKKR